MISNYEPYRELWRLGSRPVFLLADLLGAVGLLASQLTADPWKGAVAAVGSTCLTIGLSLPIALFYQLRAEGESLAIIGACHRAGIRAIFRSRQSDAEALRIAIDAAAIASTGISLLGVAFRSLFNPSGEHTQEPRERLDDPRVHLRVLLLDPDSDAAKRRATIERGNTTIDDIRFTLAHGIPAMTQERLSRVCQQDGTLKEKIAKSSIPWPDDLVACVVERCKFEVHLYDLDPMVFLMIFRDSVFAEQYHLGRPNELRTGSCIGKHVPVIEYGSAAEAAKFLSTHYDWLWKGKSRDVTRQLVQAAASAG